MKLHITTLLAALAIAGSTTDLAAQGNDNRPRRNFDARSQRDVRPPAPPLIEALDANRDGVIDATEIDNAVSALRKLDKNGDGKLTPDEYRRPQPFGRGNGPRGQNRWEPDVDNRPAPSDKD